MVADCNCTDEPGVDRDDRSDQQYRIRDVEQQGRTQSGDDPGEDCHVQGIGKEPIIPTDPREAERGDEELRLSGDYIIVAAGREPGSAFETLNLENTAVELTDQQFIETDDQMRTTDEDIFCVGDAAGQPHLAHIAYREGKVAAEAAAGGDSSFDNKVIPAVMYTDPEVAVVGLNETQAREEYDDLMTGTFPFSASGRALTANKTSGYVKVIADPDGKLLGAQVVGARASDSIAEATLALEMDAHLDDITRTIHAHPTFPEALAEAAEAAKGESIHST